MLCIGACSGFSAGGKNRLVFFVFTLISGNFLHNLGEKNSLRRAVIIPTDYLILMVPPFTSFQS
jgi:hypothetical protein